MEELFGNLENIAQQNDLLAEQNKSLREQNKRLRQQSAAISKDDGREVFVENIDRDEIRDGFLVTSHKKKLWNAQINLMQVFDRICKKHNLRWFAYGGTLLGAARHKGYIPWDDDIDLIMLRPDYEKFQSVVEEELKNYPHYRAWHWFDYRMETDAPSKYTNMSLPLMSKKQIDKYPFWAPMFPLFRLIDTSTTYMMQDDRKDVFYSVWIDIFYLDPCPPFFNNVTAKTNYILASELLLATLYPEKVKEALKNNEHFFIPREELRAFLALPYKKRAQNFEVFTAETFSRTEYVGEIRHHCVSGLNFSYKSEGFDDVIYFPFEKIELPVPIGYDNVLTEIYGNWHKKVFTHTHSNEWSTDIPYDEYRKKSFRFANTK